MSLVSIEMKFTEEETLKFVQLYREHECLWNMSSPNYKNKTLRQNAIEAIIKEIALPGFGVNEVRNKIKNLRSTYNQEVLKIKKSAKSGSGKEDVYVPSMKWFEILDPVMKYSKGTTDTSDVISNLVSKHHL